MAKYKFTEDQEKEIAAIFAKYPVKASAMLPLLTLVQRADQVVSPEAMVAIGKKLDVSPAYVQSVLSFYTMYHTEKVGKYMILFCINISCQLNGSDKLLEHTAKKLNIKKLSLETGAGDFFKPARKLFKKCDFEPCTPFAHYKDCLLYTSDAADE